MVMGIEIAAILIGLIWLIGLTIFFFRLSSHYNKLTKGMSTKTLKSLLEDLLKEVSVSQTDIEMLNKRCDTIEKDAVLHIQKIGLMRFNPFKDTGGEQSFILALVNRDNTGVIISSLYARSGTRWYAKKIVAGKGADYELSEEEKKTLKQAQSSADL